MNKTLFVQLVGVLLVGVIVGIIFRRSMHNEGFKSCGCGKETCPACREPDLSRYVLKSTVPACPQMPDLSNYILKSEVPPVPDLSNYVLKSSIPKPQPVILDCSKCNQPKGDCPPCPRPRCPEVICPAAPKCPPPAPCPRPVCPPSVVKCRAEAPVDDPVRPFLAPLSYMGFGKGL